MPDAKTAMLARIALQYVDEKPKKTLVVGCGSGIEAAVLSQELGGEVTGIDLEDRFDAVAGREAHLQVGDATQMTFADGSFDFVYSYHALEHIPHYRKALQEINRVLAPNGHWCIGTPNRSRLIGYLGSKDATAKEKILWNVDDWQSRLRGQFKNECGAHAGFTAGELSGELSRELGAARNITQEYYRTLYARHAPTVAWIYRCGVDRFIFPAVYFMGRIDDAALNA